MTSDLLHIFIMWVLILLNGWFPASNENSRAQFNMVKFCVFCLGEANKCRALSALWIIQVKCWLKMGKLVCNNIFPQRFWPTQDLGPYAHLKISYKFEKFDPNTRPRFPRRRKMLPHLRVYFLRTLSVLHCNEIWIALAMPNIWFGIQIKYSSILKVICMEFICVWAAVPSNNQSHGKWHLNFYHNWKCMISNNHMWINCPSNDSVQLVICTAKQ